MGASVSVWDSARPCEQRGGSCEGYKEGDRLRRLQPRPAPSGLTCTPARAQRATRSSRQARIVVVQTRSRCKELLLLGGSRAGGGLADCRTQRLEVQRASKLPRCTCVALPLCCRR